MSDSQDRNKIITNVNTNYFVEAGAGSGKTTMLVERMVAMVEQGFEVDKICTITFTKAAANEFYARFQKRLAERASDEAEKDHYPGRLAEKTDVTKENCRKALVDIDTCFMGTIDAFCNMVLSEHPLEAGIPASSAVVDDETIINRYLQEFTKIPVDDRYKNLRDKYSLFIDTQMNPIAIFKAVLSKVLEVRDAEFMYEKPVTRISFEKKYATDKKDLITLFEKLLDNQDTIMHETKSSIKCWTELKNRKLTLTRSNWDDNFPQVLYSLNKISGLVVKPVNIQSLLGPAMARLQPNYDKRSKNGKISNYTLAENGFQDIVNYMKDYQARVALDFTVECVKAMSQVLRKQGNLTFFDYKLYLRDLLKADAAGGHKLIEHIYERHKYFLIDEFQDTDPMQAELFFYLAAEHFDADWKKCVPHAGSLFIVGDPKQSIYRFKNADVTSFKNVRKLFTGNNGEVLDLTSNFRSTKQLHEWFNRVFGQLLIDDNEDQSPYRPIENRKDESYDDFASGIYKYDPADKKNDSQEVLDIVNTLVDNPDILIGKEKTIKYSDIMIITSKKKQLARYVKIFTEQHVPFKVEGDMDFSECPALRDLVALFKASVYPENNFYVYEALISRLLGFTAESAMRIRDSIKGIKYEGVFVSDDPEAKKAIDLINRYHGLSRKVSASALLSTMLDEQRIFAISGSHNTEYVYYVLELLREREATGEVASVEDAVTFLNSLMNREEKLERCAPLEKNDNRVYLANLHKVKGLEAPIVILAGSQSRKDSVKVEHRVEYVGDKPKCYVLAINKDFVSLSFNDTFYKKDSEKRSAEAERIRQLYVAATRAGRILIMADTSPWKEELSAFVSDEFFGIYTKRESEPPVAQQENGTQLYESVESIIKKNSASRQSSIEISKPSDIEYEKVVEEIETINLKRNPKLIGTLVHKLMEVIVSSRNSVNTEDLINDLCFGLDSNDRYYSNILHKVNGKIQTGGYQQKNGQPSDILNELLNADEVYCEVPFSFLNKANSITTGIIDVLYKKGDKWHVVDYKTNADDEELDQKYAEQLNEYLKALKINAEYNAEASIYHIDVM